MNKRKLILYISMSLDGYIATKDNDLGFLSVVAEEGEDYGYNEFIKTVDTIIIGRKTYEKVLNMGFEYPHQGKDVYIISRTKRPAIGTFQYYNKDLKTLVLNLKKKEGKNIYCDGGAEIANILMKEKLIDELIISIIPVLLGDGIKLFKAERPFQELELLSSRAYKKGLIQLHYKSNY